MDTLVGRPPGGPQVALFLAAGATTIALGLADYRSAMASPARGDLTEIFWPAAQAIARGQSPYVIPGYVYSPLWACLLVPLAGHRWGIGVGTALLIGCAILSGWVCAWALTRTQPRWQTGLMAWAAGVTVLWNWPALIGVRALRPEMLVLGVLVAAALTRGARSGLLIGVAGVLKTWPAAFVVWLLPERSGRLRRLAGFAVAGLCAAAVAWLTGGVHDIEQTVHVASSSSLQPYVAVSIPGAARLFFSANPLARPLIVSAPLSLATLVLGFAALACLAITVWRRPGDRFIALFNMVFLVQLALPVSHYSYFVLALPALWFWLARALREHDELSMVASVTLALWWILTARNRELVYQSSATSLAAYSLVFVPTLVAAAVSVLAGARLHAHNEAGSPQGRFTAGHLVSRHGGAAKPARNSARHGIVGTDMGRGRAARKGAAHWLQLASHTDQEEGEQ
ncbi:Protein of unknown function [Propionibacterium cyclohexanicum]|uniref:Alpha-1,2-mannosyltransferase n=1 Tax=Propionibacterium cyclohexanicum TaxID=64702 RepID=A0A1H9TUM9_9ACTN|nr:glycosyltransferase family 87 protein [Propionibacterium cyclohexanicum]SES00856.1 Protein of unknown function [Propionibacterium cyclohexanicum]